MKFGLHVFDFTWPQGPAGTGATLAEIARLADEFGADWISVMDHFFQMEMTGPRDRPMLEAYTTLGYLANATERVNLVAMVTGVTYRPPAILAKQVSTLDVLSGGRAMLGIGAAWYEKEHEAMGVRFPPVKERFARLEEAIQLILQMWSGNRGPFDGTYYHSTETLNVPQPIQQPRPPIMIGGSGEKKTLKLVAKYADICNVQGPADVLKHKLDVLRQHCADAGRDYDRILKTTGLRIDLGPNLDRGNEIVEAAAQLKEAGAQGITSTVANISDLRTLEVLGRDVLPQIKKL